MGRLNTGGVDGQARPMTAVVGAGFTGSGPRGGCRVVRVLAGQWTERWV